MASGEYQRLSAEDRFEKYVDRSGGPDACHLWMGSIVKSTGYGSFYYQESTNSAHRIAWVLANGPIPDGYLVRHFKCNERKCVNVRHLKLGYWKDNSADRLLHGTDARGEKSRRAILTEPIIRRAIELREQGWSMSRIGEELGVKGGTLDSAFRRKSWKHLDLPPLVRLRSGRKRIEDRGLEAGGLQPMTPHLIRKMHRLRLLGIPWLVIAERFGFRSETIKRFVKRHYPDFVTESR